VRSYRHDGSEVSPENEVVRLGDDAPLRFAERHALGLQALAHTQRLRERERHAPLHAAAIALVLDLDK
jgi:hypothetical protein